MGIKISELPAASPLTGTEPLPLVQSAETRQATVADIAPVRSVAGKTGAVTLSAPDVGAADAVHTHDYAATSHGHVIADTSDLQTTLSGKQDTLVSGTNIKTINGASLLGSGNLTVTAEGASLSDIIVYSIALGG